MIRAELRLSLGEVPYMGWAIMVLIWDGQSRPFLLFPHSNPRVQEDYRDYYVQQKYAQGDYVKTMHKGTM